jgi:16S rRNA U516 pseudouridylate synthase RsuA-like enzyme
MAIRSSNIVQRLKVKADSLNADQLFMYIANYGLRTEVMKTILDLSVKINELRSELGSHDVKKNQISFADTSMNYAQYWSYKKPKRVTS